MLPLIRRFLDLEAVADVVARSDQPGGLDEDAQALAHVIAAQPTLKTQVLSARGRKTVAIDLQQQLIVAATRAAATRLEGQADWTSVVRAALEAVVASGGTEAEGRTLVQQAVLDEAFGWAEDPESFDAAFLRETLESITALALVDTEAVEAWVEDFSKGAAAPERPLRVAVADALLEAAWSDGPQPIAAEHTDDALEALAASVARTELVKAAKTLVEFLELLAKKRVIGPLRLARLSALALAAGRGDGPELDDDEQEEGDEDDELEDEPS